jgi:SAM-dependent methyltransferase
MTCKGSSFDAASFFDKYATVYGRGSDAGNLAFEGDRIFFQFIKENPLDNTLLDVGAGAGHFASLVKLRLPDMHVTALDPSTRLLSKIEDRSIRKVTGRLPDLNLGRGEIFSFISVLNVLHHLPGRTISDSRNLARESLFALKTHLHSRGLVLIREQLWETYFIPTATRALAFSLLSFASRLNVAVPLLAPHASESVSGLIVCMYTAAELESVLKECGFEIVQVDTYQYRTSKRGNLFKKFALLKGFGQIQFIVRKVNSELA